MDNIRKMRYEEFYYTFEGVAKQLKDCGYYICFNPEGMKSLLIRTYNIVFKDPNVSFETIQIIKTLISYMEDRKIYKPTTYLDKTIKALLELQDYFDGIPEDDFWL